MYVEKNEQIHWGCVICLVKCSARRRTKSLSQSAHCGPRALPFGGRAQSLEMSRRLVRKRANVLLPFKQRRGGAASQDQVQALREVIIRPNVHEDTSQVTTPLSQMCSGPKRSHIASRASQTVGHSISIVDSVCGAGLSFSAGRGWTHNTQEHQLGIVL